MASKSPETKRDAARRWTAANPERRRAINRRRVLKKHGITSERYEALLAEQGGRCALFEVCGATQPGGRGRHWHVDHDHATGQVRGLLCHNCNVNRVGTNTAFSAIAVAKYLGAVLQ